MQATELRFSPATVHPPGTVFNILHRIYVPPYSTILERKIRAFDEEVARHPDAVGACTFVTWVGEAAVGMGSYDPRKAPECAVIGWNGVVPEFRGRGIGKAQIQEILRILRCRGIARACVTTADEEFFVPAQRMYEACGFVEIRRTSDHTIEYERDV